MENWKGILEPHMYSCGRKFTSVSMYFMVILEVLGSFSLEEWLHT